MSDYPKFWPPTVKPHPESHKKPASGVLNG